MIFGTLLNPSVGLLPWLGRRPATAASTTRDLGAARGSVVTVWQNLGLTFILMSSGLQAIPDELHEAAGVDGAGAWSRFFAT